MHEVTCEEVHAHYEPMYAQYDHFGRTDHLSHALQMGRGGCSKLIDDQRGCIVDAKTFDATYACLGKTSPEAGPKDFVALASASNEPLLIRPFHQIGLDPRWRAEGLDPKLCAKQAVIAAWCEYTTPEFPDTIFRVFRQPMVDTDDETQWPVGPFRVTVAATGVKNTLTRAWGPARETSHGSFWFHPRIPLRVAVRPAQMRGDNPAWTDLEYSGYWPLAAFIGTDKNRFGFEGDRPLLGASAADVRKRFKYRVDRGRIRLWPIETSPRDVEVALAQGLDDELPDRVESIEIDLAGVDTNQLQRLLEDKFGKPVPRESTLLYRNEPRVALDGTTLRVGRGD